MGTNEVWLNVHTLEPESLKSLKSLAASGLLDRPGSPGQAVIMDSTHLYSNSYFYG